MNKRLTTIFSLQQSLVLTLLIIILCHGCTDMLEGCEIFAPPHHDALLAPAFVVVLLHAYFLDVY